jgi:uncharacterized membrane protein
MSRFSGWLKGSTPDADRFWEVDAARGLAILMMISFHTLFDLNYFGITGFALYSGTLGIFAYSIGTIFLLLVGIGLSISYSRNRAKRTAQELRIKYLTRGLFVFGLGLVITVATYVVVGPGFIIFGVLHCIGLSIILAYPLLRFRRLNLVLGTTFIVAGIGLRSTTVDFPWLLWLGLRPTGFYTLDYFPLLPWLGVVLIGVFAGQMLYHDRERRFSLKDRSALAPTRALGFLGRHSLLIYLGHQLVIIGLIVLLLGLL